MRALGRFISVWWQACRFRLDELLPKSSPIPVKFLFLIAPLVGSKKQSRSERLKNFLQCQGPIFVKFGQLMSTRPDLLPEDIAKELQKLQDQVDPFDSALFQQIVEAGLGAPVDELFAEFESQPLASASLAQVHGAVLDNGDRVVVKVLRPDVQRQVLRDLRLMRALAKLVDGSGSDGKRLNAPEVVADYQATILRELDLEHEAANTQILRDNFNCDSDPHPANYTPKVYWDYVRPNILVCERIKGIPVNDRAAVLAQGTDLKRLAEMGVEIFFKQVFEDNFFHADMHPGNIFIASENIDKPQYISVDCAIVGTLTDSERKSLAAILLAVFQRDYRRVAEVQIRHGWVAADTSVHEFSAEIRKVCEPIIAKPLSEISFADMLVSLFSTARKFDMQVMPSLVLLEKTIINIEGLGRQLYPELDLWATAAPYLEDWWKREHSPRHLFNQFRQKAPDYLDDIAELPALVREVLEQSASQKVDKKSRSGLLKISVIGAALIGAAAGLLLANTGYLGQISTITPAILALTGLYLLVRAS